MGQPETSGKCLLKMVAVVVAGVCSGVFPGPRRFLLTPGSGGDGV